MFITGCVSASSFGRKQTRWKISCVFWEVSQTVFAQECLFTSIVFWTGVDYAKPTNESPPVRIYHSVLDNIVTYVWVSVLMVTVCASASCSCCHLSHSHVTLKTFAFAGSVTLPRLKSSPKKSGLFVKFHFFHLHLLEFHFFSVFYRKWSFKMFPIKMM